MKKKRKSVIAVIAVITAVVGAAFAISSFLKRKAKDIGEKLDYDAGPYYDDNENNAFEPKEETDLTDESNESLADDEETKENIQDSDENDEVQ